MIWASKILPAMRDQCRVEQGHVGRIGKHALVEEAIGRHFAAGANPDILAGLTGRGARIEVVLRLARAQFDRPVALEKALERCRHFARGSGEEILLARQALPARAPTGVDDLVLQSGLRPMEGGRHGKDRLAMLDGDHPPGREAAAVAIAGDLIDDRHARDRPAA